MSENYLLVDGTGKAIEIKGDTKIGRSKTNNVVLTDPLASRHHATVYLEGEVLMIRDEQSVNGTIVNRSQIYDPVALKDRDTIQFGDEIFTVRAPLTEAKTMLKSEKDIGDMGAWSGEEAVKSAPTAKKARDTKTPAKQAAEAPKPPKKAAEPVPPPEAVRSRMEIEGPPKKADNKKILLIAGAVLALCVCCIITFVVLQSMGWLELPW